MSNKRTDIRSALSTMIDNGNLGVSVYTSRTKAIPQERLPAVTILTSQESAIPRAQNTRQLIRDLEVTLEVRVQATEEVDDELDELVAGIEDLIDANPTLGLGGTVLTTILTNTEMRLGQEGESDIGFATLTFQTKYIA